MEKASNEFDIDYNPLSVLRSRNNTPGTICIQVPEYLLPHSKFIVEKVKNVVPQNTIALVADSSFPDCCIDIVSARHKDNMYIIKVGGVCSSYLKSISGIIVLPIKYKMDRFFPELNNSFDEKIDCGYYKWVGIAERCENNFKTYSESIFGKDRLIYNIFAENADLSQMGKGLVIVTDQSLNEDICLMSRIEADYVFLDFEKKTKKIVDSTRERSKRWAVLQKLPKNRSLAFGLVIHSTSKIHADLSFRVATYLRSNNHPCYIFSAGRLTPQKLGNFADIDVFIIIGCIRPMYLNGPFFVPVITVYELFCHLELCDFWDDMNTDDPERLTNFLINIKDETDEQSHISNTESNSISLTNIDYSLRSFASKEYKGVPHYMVEKIDEKSTPSIEILPGSTGLPREYHDF